MSFRMPAAVTSAPAPGPLITSGSVRYRRVVKATRLRVPSSAPAGLDAGTAASFADTVRGVARHQVPQHASALGFRRARAAHSSSNASSRSRNSAAGSLLRALAAPDPAAPARARDSPAAAPGSAPCAPHRAPSGRRADPARRTRRSTASRTACENGLPDETADIDVHQRAADATLRCAGRGRPSPPACGTCR